MSSKDTAISPGTIINQYKIISAIGKGGMGEVFLAQDTKLDRKVALKILPPEFAEDKDRMARFVREAKSASALNHPNIITIYEIGEANGTNYIATEFIEGETLQRHLKGENVSLKSVLDIATQIASALQTAHSVGIVHRDIKPDNVMIRKDGLAKILDFGIAKLTNRQGDTETREHGEEDKTLIAASPSPRVAASTNPGMIIGTANYMSPEQAKGKEIDARSDIFSFGIVFYEMLTGKRAFEGETAIESISSILKDAPKPITQFLPEVPGEIERIVNKTLKKDREERYQTAKDLVVDLKDAKQSLELQNLMERSIVPNKDANKTQILQATTLDEINQTNTNQTVASNPTKKYLAAGLLALLLAVGGFFGYQYLSPTTNQIESIAVMPFVNDSKNEDIEYLSDGMTETLINSLSQIPNLSVKARSSVFRYKGKEQDLKKIAAELNVQAILTGHVVQRGDQLTLNLELIDPKTENRIWGSSYQRKSIELVSLQSEIARDVSTKLKSKLSGDETAKVEKNYTANSEAYQLYLQGRYQWNKRETKAFERAVEFFKQAIAKDPNYALAYTGLADTYALMPAYGEFRPKDYLPKAKEAALKALELDPNLAEAHASLGQILIYGDYDFAGAERAYKRAIEINPNYATARQWYGELLSPSGRHDEAIRELSKAVELEPFSMIINKEMRKSFFFAKRFDEALLQNRKVNELFPDDNEFHGVNSEIYAAQGNYQKAFDEFILLYRSWKEISPKELEEIVRQLTASFQKGGWDGVVRFEAANNLKYFLDKQAKDKNLYIPPISFAVCYADLKDKDKTIEYLNKAYDDRFIGLLFLNVRFQFDFLRDDPRFKELVKKVGIPE